MKGEKGERMDGERHCIFMRGEIDSAECFQTGAAPPGK
jgi:hypothetical protein